MSTSSTPAEPTEGAGWSLASRSEDAIARELGAHQLLLVVWQHWEKVRRDRPMPEPRDIDPVLLPPSVLPHLMIIGVIEGEPLRFRFRLVGSAITALARAELTGKHLDEIMSGEKLAFFEYNYGLVTQGRRPVYTRNNYGSYSAPDAHNSYLTLPLSSDGAAVDRLLIASCVNNAWLVQCDLQDRKPFIPPARSLMML